MSSIEDAHITSNDSEDTSPWLSFSGRAVKRVLLGIPAPTIPLLHIVFIWLGDSLVHFENPDPCLCSPPSTSTVGHSTSAVDRRLRSTAQPWPGILLDKLKALRLRANCNLRDAADFILVVSHSIKVQSGISSVAGLLPYTSTHG